MLPLHHAIIGAIAAAILYPFLGASVLVIILITVALDVDHYFIYIHRTGNYSLKKAYYYFRAVKDGSSFFPIFHMIEIAVIAALISNYFPILLPFLIGQILHIAQDYFEDLFSRTTNRNFFIVKLLIRK
ncbi:TPA: hypothetical protein H1016_00340 [archaeon]|uniref:Metal-dependent hydrolase n=1 Tax=Candidatus Naiadarchaeum limnaeum TaxID=2756139 RepID=A0A832V9A7_9ARCH|nr:hypothetical protein [Candidatus Naiadarchaeum limnaeum]